MKKNLLIVIVMTAMLQSQAVTRVTLLNPSAGTAQIKNFAGFQYDYSQFQMSIETNYATLTSKTHTGNLNMLPNGIVNFSNLSIPPTMQNGDKVLLGASIAIWYPNSLPGNATPANLVDFFQYGSAGHAYESVAVAAGIWTAGDFVSVPAPYQFNGGITDYGLSFFSTATGINEIKNLPAELQVIPNPVNNEAKIIIPTGFNTTQQPVELIIFDVKGEAVLTNVKNGAMEYFIDCNNLPDGIYTFQLKDNLSNTINSKFIKQSK